MFSKARATSFSKVATKLTFVLAIALTASIGITPAVDAETLRERLAARRAARSGGDTAGAVTITSGGIERSFYIHVPEGIGASPGAVLGFHGGGGTGKMMLDKNPLVPASDAGKFIVVFPNSLDGNWTDGRIATQGGPDDVGFVRDIIAYLSANYGVDPGRVFASGISNGAIFNHKLACDAPGMIRAIAPVAGNMSESLMAACNPGRGTPVMMFNGTADPFMPFEGGKPENAAMIERSRGSLPDTMVSSEDTAAFWARLNGCGGATAKDLADPANDGTTVRQLTFSCSSRQVFLFVINGGGHTWPGSTSQVAARLNGKTSKDIDATGTMINFFRAYGL